MRKPSRVGALCMVIAAVGLIAACDNDPKPTAGPSPNPQPVVVRVEISGPASIPPGQSAQFTAVLRLSDGTSETATSVRWFSRSGVVRVDETGLVTAGLGSGEDIVVATVTSNGLAVPSGSREILVLPDGTYRVVGVVTEDVPPAAPVVGARVEVTSGPPVAAVTDFEGRYRLYGVPRVANIRVTRDGYQPKVQSVQLAEHATQDFQLTLSGVRLDLTGSYTLGIEVDCGTTSTPVPANLRQLRYAASLTQSGPTLEAVLTESSRFRVNGNGHGDRFRGRVDTTGATFTLEGFSADGYYSPPSDYANVVERVSMGTFLVVNGTVSTSGSAASLSGFLRGYVSHHNSTFPTVPLLSSVRGTCYSATHRFTLTPR